MRETFEWAEGWSRSSDNFVDDIQENVTLPDCPVLEQEVVNTPFFGKIWYRRRFFIPAEWKKRAMQVEIDAAMQTTRVFLNGVYQFTRFGGYQRFVIPLNENILYDAENVLTLEVDNTPQPDCPPGKPWRNLDFCYYSGLYRSARLTVTEAIHISDPLAVSLTAGGGIFIRTLEAGPERALLSLRLHAVHEVDLECRWCLAELGKREFPCSLQVVVTAPDGTEVGCFGSETVNLRMNTDHTFELELPVDRPELWDVDRPALYRVDCTLWAGTQAVDRRTVRYGIRTLAFQRDGFRLNGRKIELRGTNRHQEFPYVGNAAPATMQRRDAWLIKQAHYNFVRLSHYNQHPAFLDACDELGLLVIAPIPGWQYFSLNGSFVERALRDCRELIRTERNRPSVMLWEVSLNEAYPPGWLNGEFHRTAHREYPGDQCFTCGDVYGWFDDWDVLFFRPGLETDKPVLMREYGDWGFGGNNSTSRQSRGGGRAALLQQAWNFQWTYNQLRAMPGVIGGATWVMFDYNRGYHHQLEQSGDTDFFRVPKYKYHFYRSQGAGEPMVFIADDWLPREGEDKVVVFSNCDEVELLVNGRTLARRRPDNGADSPYNPERNSPGWETALLDEVDESGGVPFDGGNCRHLPHPPFTFAGIVHEPGVLRAVGYRRGEPAAEMTVRTPGPAVALECRVRTDGVEWQADGDLIFVDVCSVDADGTVVPGRSDRVTLRIDGDAVMVGSPVRSLEAGITTFLVRGRPAALTASPAE